MHYVNTIRTRHEAIMLQKLSVMLLSSAPKIISYAFKKMPKIMSPIFSKQCKFKLY